MKYCPYCGTGLNDDMSFCFKCGESQGWNIKIDKKSVEVSTQQDSTIQVANGTSEIHVAIPVCNETRDLNSPVDERADTTQTFTEETENISNNETQKVYEKGTKNRKPGIISISFFAVLLGIGLLISLTCAQTSREKYKNAVALMESKDYKEAFLALKEISGYKDSKLLKESIKSEYENEALKTVNIGDTLYFGEYEQDNNTSNGKEDIEWLVLDKRDSKTLVVSKYSIDCKPYNEKNEETSWADCSIRAWLNNTFLKTAFNDNELLLIKNKYLLAHPNLGYNSNTFQGSSTHDKVFLLSSKEADSYFSSNEDRISVPTAYAKANGAWTSDTTTINGKASCMWWLRTLGESNFDASFVGGVGSIGYAGMKVNFDSGSIRPAMWLDYDWNKKPNKEWITIEEYYDNDEDKVGKLFKCMGYVSHKEEYKFVKDESNIYDRYGIRIVENEYDVLGYEIPYGKEYSDIRTEARKHESSVEVIPFSVSKEVYDRLNCGDRIVFNFAYEKNEVVGYPTLLSLESINGETVNIMNSVE